MLWGGLPSTKGDPSTWGVPGSAGLGDAAVVGDAGELSRGAGWRCPSPAHCTLNPVGALTFRCPAEPVGAMAELSTSSRWWELVVLTWEHQKPLIQYPNGE